jgi:NADH-quinone oxidoreductase subunit L
MSLPLIILASVSVVAGFIPFGHFVTWNREAYDIHLDIPVAVSSVVIALLAIAVATKMYRKENELPAKFANALPRLWDWCHHRFYFDELYMFITHKIIFKGICKPIAWFDRHIIDGTMDAFAAVTNKVSFAIRGLQSGNIQLYVWVYLIGVLLLGGVTIVLILL